MKSIERRFNKISKKNPYWRSIACFTEATKNQNFSKGMINRWFNKLVENDDYSKKDKKDILKDIYKTSKETFKPKEEQDFIPKYYSK